MRVFFKLGISNTKAVVLSLVEKIQKAFKKTELEDQAIIENLDGLEEPLEFLTQNPVGG